MNKADGVTYAKVYGVDFPVCSIKQKEQIEQAYKDAMSHLDAHPEEKVGKENDCTCNLIISLLSGSANRSEIIAAATALARDVYELKSATAMMRDVLEGIVLKQATGRETVH
jgi:hypothetical protein